MNMRKKAEDYYNNLYALPPSPEALAEFAEQILNEFVGELKKNSAAVTWGYGCDSAVFMNRVLEGRKNILEIQEEFINDRGNESIETITDGERSTRDREEDKEA